MILYDENRKFIRILRYTFDERQVRHLAFSSLPINFVLNLTRRTSRVQTATTHSASLCHCVYSLFPSTSRLPFLRDYESDWNRLKIHSAEYLESRTSKRLEIDSFCSMSVKSLFQRTTNRFDLFLHIHRSVSIGCTVLYTVHASKRVIDLTRDFVHRN